MTVHAEIRSFINDNYLFEDDEAAVPMAESLFGAGRLDSANMVDIVLHLERTYGVSIPSTDITPDNFDTIDRMAGYIERLRGT